MSTPDYRRLATIIREQNPAPRGDDDYITGIRRHTMRDVADAYDTLADYLEAEPKPIDVTNYGSTAFEYVINGPTKRATAQFRGC